MSVTAAAIPASRRRQLAVAAALCAIVVALLSAAYWYFLSGGYAVLTERVRPEEAAAIVAELDHRGTAYRLRDGGTTILVPEAEADATRLAITRSDAAASGQIGFELFNKSDMGLTNFAQKINYQRALQGELVRTITMLDGVESARVHLALPERALFRDDRTPPSAAVTVAMRGGASAEPASVAGIQQLVAAAVPDLPADRVVVLDADGRVISRSGTGDTADDGAGDTDRPVALEQRLAVEQYYRARARAAIEQRMPELRYQLRVVALPQADGVVDPAGWTPGEQGGDRNFRLRLTLVTPGPAGADDEASLRGVVEAAAGLAAARGDELLFETGSLQPPAPLPAAASPPSSAVPRSVDAPVEGAPGGAPAGPSMSWRWGIVALLAVALLIWRARSGRPSLSGEEHEAFAQTLRRQLALSDGPGHAAR